MVKSMPARSEVNIDETWDLQSLFASDQEFHDALSSLEKDVETFAARYQGVTNDAASVNELLKAYAEINEKFVPVGTYASLKMSTDQTDDEAQMLSRSEERRVGKECRSRGWRYQ